MKTTNKNFKIVEIKEQAISFPLSFIKIPHGIYSFFEAFH